jgi:hypothetical protein
MRTCTKCNEPKELSEFASKNRSKGTLSSECKECHKLVRNRYYQNNKVVERARVDKFKKQYNAWWRELKSKLVCRDCNENHPAVLHFHHLDPKEKETNIAAATSKRWSKKRVLNEIEKCIVLCANCHLKLHWTDLHKRE